MIKIICYSAFVFGALYFTLLAHERVHKEINYNYGIKTKVKINMFNSFAESEMTKKEKKLTALPHSINELYGYPLLVFTATILVGFGFIIFGG